MARKLSEAYSSPNTTSINLTQLLSRLESNILSPSADLKPLLRSQYHRARVGANIEYGRNLLLQLERNSADIKHPQRKQTVQSDLSQKRQQLKILRQRLDDLGTQAHARARAAANTTTSPEYIADASVYSSEDEEDILPTPQDSVTPENVSSRASMNSSHIRDDPRQTEGQDQSVTSEASMSSMIPTPPSSSYGSASAHSEALGSNTLRNRSTIPTPAAAAQTTTDTTTHPSSATMSTGTFTTSAYPTTSTLASPLKPSPSSNTHFRPRNHSRKATEVDPEALLAQDRQEQESLTDSLLTLAQQLKTSTQTFNTTLESEKSIIDRAVEGLDRNTTGLESAGQKMSMLRRMSEGRGWWGRMLMYLWIFGLWIVAIMIVYVGPKLRF
ncbi:synaptobrevin [Nannizzia gypsea CBS 118893]|uniref:Synaptobrevin n=1 Tax=Arthroderma gypseum (strain ATCC MYA-4604 / CBS 118893) TaxID=535722 RepID=E4USW1_ARTGP|nr:synaptobrevin [Nannizzia gypsea CBS 118893]EFR01410.1 synaptobrevin [Nannizzia gypsea CBS 118893]